MSLVASLAAAPVATAADACSERAVVTIADVSVSDGGAFVTHTWYHSPKAAAMRQSDDDGRDTWLVVDGPLSWYRQGGHAAPGNGQQAFIVLGHQFHAGLLDFDGLVDEPVDRTIEFDGRLRSARGGDIGGGRAWRVEGERPERPAGFVYEPDGADIRIRVSFDDWRTASTGRELPFRAHIDDGDRQFDYRFRRVDTAPRSPLWFFDEVPAPALDDVQVYRLHRRLLAAHCLGDADLMADLSVAEPVVASGGELFTTSRESMRERFSELFARLDYTSYVDLSDPVVTVSEAGDIGWLAVHVRARGQVHETARIFDDQWAWVMMVQKVDGRWLHAGNASNRGDFTPGR